MFAVVFDWFRVHVLDLSVCVSVVFFVRFVSTSLLFVCVSGCCYVCLVCASVFVFGVVHVFVFASCLRVVFGDCVFGCL